MVVWGSQELFLKNLAKISREEKYLSGEEIIWEDSWGSSEVKFEGLYKV